MRSTSHFSRQFDLIRRRIADAAARNDRDVAELTIVAVTKTRPVSGVLDALAAGIFDIGESKVQEAEAKFVDSELECRLHLIGHLQKNKVNKAVRIFDVIQSVDSVALARRINQRCEALRKRMQVLVEVNSSGESQKYGFRPDAVEAAVAEIAGFPNLELRGLMTIGPLAQDRSRISEAFRRTHDLFRRLQASLPDRVPFDTLSMGMSDDFELAIAEGATMLRIGTALFGSRN
jgi:hypothetical protein